MIGIYNGVMLSEDPLILSVYRDYDEVWFLF